MPIKQDRCWQMENRERRKEEGENSWYEKEGYETALFEKFNICKINSKTNCKSIDVVYQLNCRGSYDEKEMCIGKTAKSIGEKRTRLPLDLKTKATTQFYKQMQYEHNGILQKIQG